MRNAETRPIQHSEFRIRHSFAAFLKLSVISNNRVNSRRWRRVLERTRTYWAISGKVIEAQEYTTTLLTYASLSFPQLRASPGVAPDNPPQCGASVVSCRKESCPPLER